MSTSIEKKKARDCHGRWPGCGRSLCVCVHRHRFHLPSSSWTYRLALLVTVLLRSWFPFRYSFRSDIRSDPIFVPIRYSFRSLYQTNRVDVPWRSNQTWTWTGTGSVSIDWTGIPFESDAILRSILTTCSKQEKKKENEDVWVQVFKKKWRGIVTADGQDVAVAFTFVFVVIRIIHWSCYCWTYRLALLVIIVLLFLNLSFYVIVVEEKKRNKRKYISIWNIA